MIKVNSILIEQNRFPDNTLALKLSESVYKKGTSCILWLYENDAEMFTISCLVDILHRLGYEKINLNMPYCPNSRLDRIKSLEENFSLKVFANWLNSLNFANVYTYNVHSNVSEALINNLQSFLPEGDVYNVMKEYNPDVIFFPDEGACKRYSDMEVIKESGLPIAFSIKRRDWKTGNILGLDIIGAEEIKDKKILIVDDICSKGFTFFYSAQKLKIFGAKDIALYISHCEDNIQNGQLLTTDLISKIYTTNSICHVKHDKIKIIKEF